MRVLLLLLTSALLTMAILPVSLLAIATFSVASLAMLLSQHVSLVAGTFFASFTFIALPASFLILLCLPVVMLVLGLRSHSVNGSAV